MLDTILAEASRFRAWVVQFRVSGYRQLKMQGLT